MVWAILRPTGRAQIGPDLMGPTGLNFNGMDKEDMEVMEVMEDCPLLLQH